MHNIKAQEAEEKIKQGAILLDVRTKPEFDAFHIDLNVLFVPHTEVEKATKLIPNKDSVIVVTCRSGKRGEYATNALINIGYTNVYNIDGGLIEFNNYLFTSGKISKEEYEKAKIMIDKRPDQALDTRQPRA